MKNLPIRTSVFVTVFVCLLALALPILAQTPDSLPPEPEPTVAGGTPTQSHFITPQATHMPGTVPPLPTTTPTARVLLPYLSAEFTLSHTYTLAPTFPLSVTLPITK